MTHDYDAHNKIRKLGYRIDEAERNGTVSQSHARKLREEFDEVRRNQHLMAQEQERMAKTIKAMAEQIRQLQAQLFPIDKTDKPVLKAPAANDRQYNP